jgi:hypothetical protein
MLYKGSGKHRHCKRKEEFVYMFGFLKNESLLKVTAIEGENKTCAYVPEVANFVTTLNKKINMLNLLFYKLIKSLSTSSYDYM